MKKLSAACLVAFTMFAAVAGGFTLLTATSTPAMAKCGIGRADRQLHRVERGHFKASKPLCFRVMVSLEHYTAR